MAEPGDPQHPDDHDDHVGFSSAASLQGRPRDLTPESGPELEAEPEPVLATPEPEAEPDLFDPPAADAEPVAAAPETPAAPERRPASADSIFEASPNFTGRSRDREPPIQDLPSGGMSLYAVYALILLAVPTLGVSAVIALAAVTGRAGPADALSRSHFVYQQRTLWAAFIVGLIGVVLVPAGIFALGISLIFFLALWVVLRGATGVWNLKSGRAISNPLTWWI
jgi:uncharacterized membrane protein